MADRDDTLANVGTGCIGCPVGFDVGTSDGLIGATDDDCCALGIDVGVCDELVGATDDCCVLGVPDPEFGEKLVAFIEADDELEDGEIRSYLEDKIAAFKIPRVIQKVSKLPREDSGKIKKKKLKEAFIQQHKGA